MNLIVHAPNVLPYFNRDGDNYLLTYYATCSCGWHGLKHTSAQIAGRSADAHMNDAKRKEQK